MFDSVVRLAKDDCLRGETSVGGGQYILQEGEEPPQMKDQWFHR